MGLADSLTSLDTLALDTNILITAFNKSGIYGIASNKLLDKIFQVNPQVFISTIVFEEFLIQIYKKKLEKDISSYEDFITGGGFFTVVDVTRQIARAAAKIRANYPSIRAPDAIHLATALESKANFFITFDKRLPRKIENLKIEIIPISLKN